MFIKDIVLGILGIIGFSVAGMFVKNSYFVVFGLIFSFGMVLFYFVNVYVMGKRRTFFLLFASWVVILSLVYPFSLITYGDVKLILNYTGLVSFGLSWVIVLIELFLSQTFKGY